MIGSLATPKNLAMALTVESAGLLEMFQWTTLSESRGVVRDPAYKERVAHGVADVLLCLLQLADQAGWTCQSLWSKHCVPRRSNTLPSTLIWSPHARCHRNGHANAYNPKSASARRLGERAAEG